MFIYLIKNNINGKVYIGKTEYEVEKRWKKHLEAVKRKVNRYLYNAMNKYGVDNFSIKAIDICDDKEKLCEREKFWIKFYKSIDKNFGYNMQEGGIGGRQSQEIIERIRMKKKGFKHSLLTRIKMSQAKKGKFNHFQSESTRKKLSLIVKKLWNEGRLTGENNAMRGKIGKMHHFYGKHHTKDAKLKISKARLGRKGSERQREVARKNWMGFRNPNYTDINKEELEGLLLQGKNNKLISDYFDTTVQTIISKTKLYFGILPSEFRRL